MGDFFKGLEANGLFRRWASILDWLFDERKLCEQSGWSPSYTRSLSIAISGLLISQNIDCKTYSSKRQIEYSLARPKRYCVSIKGNGLTKTFLRHLRNGIAHGHCSLLKSGGTLCIKLFDYNGDATKPEKMTAYLFIPLDFVKKVYSEYLSISNRGFPSKRTKKGKGGKSSKKVRDHE